MLNAVPSLTYRYRGVLTQDLQPDCATVSFDYQQGKLIPYWKEKQPGSTYYLQKLLCDIFGLVTVCISFIIILFVSAYVSYTHLPVHFVIT